MASSKDIRSDGSPVLELRQPRALSAQQQNRILSKLARFAGQPFATYAFQDSESINLARTVAHMLLQVQWSLQKPYSDLVIGELGITTITGVQIEVAPSRARQFRASSQILADALSAEGIPCRMVEVPAREKSPDAIHVLIGKKPM